jgi:hypothetical protein
MLPSVESPVRARLVWACQPVQLGTAGELPAQLFARLALIGELVVVMVPAP